MIGGCVQKSGKNPHKDDFDRTRTLNQWILCTLFSDSPYSNLVRHLLVIMVVKILNVQKPVHLSFGTWLPMILKYNVDSRKKQKRWMEEILHRLLASKKWLKLGFWFPVLQ